MKHARIRVRKAQCQLPLFERKTLKFIPTPCSVHSPRGLRTSFTDHIRLFRSLRCERVPEERVIAPPRMVNRVIHRSGTPEMVEHAIGDPTFILSHGDELPRTGRPDCRADCVHPIAKYILDKEIIIRCADHPQVARSGQIEIAVCGEFYGGKLSEFRHGRMPC